MYEIVKHGDEWALRKFGSEGILFIGKYGDCLKEKCKHIDKVVADAKKKREEFQPVFYIRVFEEA